MQMYPRGSRGFTMVELLVVLVIIAILAAVATPMFVQNTKRAKASEAVATMGLIRQSLRDYHINRGLYFNVAENTTDGNIQNSLPTGVDSSSLKPTAPSPNAGLDINVGVPQYFSNHSFYVEAGTSTVGPTSVRFANPPAVDFIVKVKGKNSKPCEEGEADDPKTANCAIKASDVKDYELEMDNSGRTYICYKECSKTENWSLY